MNYKLNNQLLFLIYIMYDVFISYSRKDSFISDRVCLAFKKNNISYYIDRSNSTGGGEIPTELANAILNSKIFLFLASKNSYNSPFCNIEVSFAFNKARDIVPYIIDNSQLPTKFQFTFSNLNVINISNYPIESHLISTILGKLGRYPSSTSKCTNIPTDTTSDSDSPKPFYYLSVLSFIGGLYFTIKYNGRGPWYYYSILYCISMVFLFMGVAITERNEGDDDGRIGALFLAICFFGLGLALLLGGWLNSFWIGLIVFVLFVLLGIYFIGCSVP